MSPGVIVNDPIVIPGFDRRQKRVRLVARKPKLDIRVRIGWTPATPTGGFAGYGTVDRPKRTALTEFNGTAPFTQDVPIRVGSIREEKSIERQVRNIERLGDDTVFRAYGPIHRPGIHYVFAAEPDFGEARRRRDGVLYYQEMTLHLMEFVRPDQIRIRRRKRNGGARFNDPIGYTVGNYITRKGDTLYSIAAKELGSAKRWREIAKLNPGTNDPNKELEPGRALRMP